MRILCFVSHKGGVGKTTLAAALVAGARDLGLRPGVLDLDPANQGLSRFVRLRRDRGLPTGSLLRPPMWPRTRTPTSQDAGAGVQEAVDHAVSLGLDALLIDMEAVSTALWLKAAACLVADVVVTPVGDSPLDLDSVLGEQGRGELAEFIAAAGPRRPDWVLARNRTSHLPTRLGEAMAERIGRGEVEAGYRVIEALKDRVAYREMFITGRTPLDAPESELSMSALAARTEMRRLAERLLAPQAARLLSVA